MNRSGTDARSSAGNGFGPGEDGAGECRHEFGVGGPRPDPPHGDVGAGRPSARRRAAPCTCRRSSPSRAAPCRWPPPRTAGPPPPRRPTRRRYRGRQCRDAHGHPDTGPRSPPASPALPHDVERPGTCPRWPGTAPGSPPPAPAPSAGRPARRAGTPRHSRANRDRPWPSGARPSFWAAPPPPAGVRRPPPWHGVPPCRPCPVSARPRPLRSFVPPGGSVYQVGHETDRFRRACRGRIAVAQVEDVAGAAGGPVRMSGDAPLDLGVGARRAPPGRGCPARPGRGRAASQASSTGMRQSTPITSPPALAISGQDVVGARPEVDAGHARARPRRRRSVASRGRTYSA